MLLEILIFILVITFVVGAIVKILSNPVLLCVIIITVAAGYIGSITGHPIAFIVCIAGLILAAGGLRD